MCIVEADLHRDIHQITGHIIDFDDVVRTHHRKGVADLDIIGGLVDVGGDREVDLLRGQNDRLEDPVGRIIGNGRIEIEALLEFDITQIERGIQVPCRIAVVLVVDAIMVRADGAGQGRDARIADAAAVVLPVDAFAGAELDVGTEADCGLLVAAAASPPPNIFDMIDPKILILTSCFSTSKLSTIPAASRGRAVLIGVEFEV